MVKSLVSSTSTWLKEILDDDFFTRIESEAAGAELLNDTGSVKTFVHDGKTYVAIIGADAPYHGVDYKARYTAVIAWYKRIYNRICDMYGSPEALPYTFALPAIYAHTRARGGSVMIVEYVDDLCTLEDISRGKVTVPWHTNPINQFLHDWHAATISLGIETKASLGSNQILKFVIHMDGARTRVILRDDFQSWDEDFLRNVGYSPSRSTKEKPYIVLTDALIAIEAEPAKATNFLQK